MTQEANHDNRPENEEAFPACCRDAGEKMAGCGPMMEKMMAGCGPMMEEMLARFERKASEGACGESDESQ